jgi:hypothetical protein
METNKENDEILEEFEKQIENQKEIVKLLNALYQSTFEEYYTELKINDYEKMNIFELLKNKLKYLELNGIEKKDNFKEMLAINLFKTLFIGNNTFSMEDLDKKKEYFNTILKIIRGKVFDFTDLNIHMKLIKEIEGNAINQLFSQFKTHKNIKNYDILIKFSLYLIFQYLKSNEIFVSSIIAYIKSEYKLTENDTDLELKKEYLNDEIEKIPKNVLLDDLSAIFKKIDNCTILYIENGHLQIKHIPLEELDKAINESVKKKKKRKNKKTNKTKKTLNEISMEKNEIKVVTKDEKDKLEEKKDNNNDNNTKELTIEEKLTNLNIRMQKQEKELQQQKQKIAEQSSIIAEQSSRINNLEEEMDEKNIIVKNYKSNIEEISHKLINFESELRLIQARDAIKNIIDLFSKALKIRQDISYHKKVDSIKNKINKLKFKNVDNNDIIKFIYKIYLNWDSSNKNAHSLDLDSSILEQIFIFIDPDDKLEKLRKQLTKGKMDDLLFQLAENREKNYNDKYLLFYEEKKIIDSVNQIEDFIE